MCINWANIINHLGIDRRQILDIQIGQKFEDDFRVKLYLNNGSVYHTRVRLDNRGNFILSSM